MLGKPLQLRTLCFAANPDTIHTCGSSGYGVLKLEDSHFNMYAMAEETREFKTDSFVCGFHVCWTAVIGEQLVCDSEEGNPRDQYAVVSCLKSGNIIGHVTFQCFALCL